MKTFRILFPGLLAAQVIATIQVYISNVDLSRALDAIKGAGYLPVPNQHIASGLRDLGPAFSGGMFLTLSVGAGIALLALLSVWVWDRIFVRNRVLFVPFLMIWIGGLVKVNGQGISPAATAYLLVIPPIVFAAAMRWMPPQRGERGLSGEVASTVPLVLLAVLWASQMGGTMFLDIRDNLLLSNAVGTRINDLYYTYTLYPAEAFKTLDQKTLKTCNLEHVKRRPFVQSLERTLAVHDYLHTEGYRNADLAVEEENGVLLFRNRGRAILRTGLRDFSLRPSIILKEFSAKSDRDAFFRRVTFFSILIGFPVLLYIVIYALIHMALNLFLDPKGSSIVTSIICFSLGVALVLPLFTGERAVGAGDIEGALQSGHWRHRVAALKTVQEMGLDVTLFGNYRGMLTSPHVPERYWLAGALGYGRGLETYRDLLVLLDDSSPNVVCKAFEALGKRGNTEAVGEIIQRIETSDHWYEQWYAYRALRTLGWRQIRSQ